MPLLTEREAVKSEYVRAVESGWVLPALGIENLTTAEATLSAALRHAELLGVSDLPVILALTNLYDHRQQTVHYTHTRRWDIGLRLFLADVAVLCSPGSPFEDLRVMVHLDHIQHDVDADLLAWDMGLFSSIMYDASTLAFEENIRKTAEFVERHGKEIYIEGACDEITEAGSTDKIELTTPEQAEAFVRGTGCDVIVPNLGTEHRASGKDLHYADVRAREVRDRVGPMLCLHGASSIAPEQLGGLASDGVVKVNFWTALERDSSPVLMEDMLRNASRVAGVATAERLHAQEMLGARAERTEKAALSHFTTAYRHQVVFEAMEKMLLELFEMFMPTRKGKSR